MSNRGPDCVAENARWLSDLEIFLIPYHPWDGNDIFTYHECLIFRLNDRQMYKSSHGWYGVPSSLGEVFFEFEGQKNINFRSYNPVFSKPRLSRVRKFRGDFDGVEVRNHKLMELEKWGGRDFF